ncbi:phosphatidylserine decarboxylase family protein [Aureitalea marina]|uniref:Phosphatidylserine decarboxylase proenzyme n=1 Tax=Aureitalea marina TaxID=930804 RepID=A0A2S7KME3_9FLAO|nr:phosphatidylserine decarboxylase family protein [Aureitalea marina]PQB03772.1 phosphatidylserine decarboxylase [Aureitalea marina]
MFHKEGHKIILITLLICIAGSVVVDTRVSLPWLRWTLLVGILILLVLILQFFRNPKRRFSLNQGQVLSPVDGKVVVIEEVFEPEYFKDKRLQISVFMSPLNVHVTRYPLGGAVSYSKYHPGKYLVAWHPKSSEENERTTVVVKSPQFGEVLHRQIAGAMARRIVNYAEEGQEVEQASDSGFIKFGSRVDVFLPIGTAVEVSLDQKVKGGITVLASNHGKE